MHSTYVVLSILIVVISSLKICFFSHNSKSKFCRKRIATPALWLVPWLKYIFPFHESSQIFSSFLVQWVSYRNEILFSCSSFLKSDNLFVVVVALAHLHWKMQNLECNKTSMFLKTQQKTHKHGLSTKIEKCIGKRILW